MNNTMSKLDVLVLPDLRREAAARTARLNALLGRHQQLVAWGALGLPAELGAFLQEERAEIQREIADLLVGWRQLGGEVSLGATGAALPVEEEPVPVVPSEPVVRELPPVRPPVREPPREVIPAGPRATPEMLAGLKAHVEAGGGFKIQAPAADWPARLSEQLAELRPGTVPDAELSALVRVVEATERWKALPAEAQSTLVGLLAARLRALQEVPELGGDRRIDFAFGSLSAYMKRARPGFAYGLARWHTPTRGSWEADAEALHDRLLAMIPEPEEAEPNRGRQLDRVESMVNELATTPSELASAVEAQVRREVLLAFAAGVPARHPRLVRLLAPVVGLFDGPEFRSLRRAIREETEDDAADAREAAGDEAALPADWPWWGWTRGKTALIVGGDPREQSRVRLEQAFELAELEWVGAEYKRNNLIGVRDRVRSGKVDLVILLTRFTGHDADQIILPACREVGVPFVCVQHGYGVVRVRHAIERFLDPEGRKA